MHDVRQGLDLGDLEIRLLCDRDLRRARNDQMRFDIAIPQQFEQPNAIDRA
jgi:hypothetical protein